MVTRPVHATVHVLILAPIYTPATGHPELFACFPPSFLLSLPPSLPQFPYIPVLPVSLLELLNAPGIFMYGICTAEVQFDEELDGVRRRGGQG